MHRDKKNWMNNPWFKLNLLGFTGGFTGSYIAVFFLDFFNPLDLFVPPLECITWSVTCAFLGFFVINSILITEKLKRKTILSIVIYILLFIIHSLTIKAIIPGIGKLFEISGFGMGIGFLLGLKNSRKFDSTIKSGLYIMSLVFIFSFVFIGIRYLITTTVFFGEPIDLEIWFSWTIMCLWIAFFIGFESYIN
jgi:hypothetical protein